MRPVLGLGEKHSRSPAWHPCCQSHTKNCSTPAEQGRARRATVSHHKPPQTTARVCVLWTVDCGEVWNLLNASHSLPPSRSFEGPPCALLLALPAWVKGIMGHPGQGPAFRRAVRF
jgi:hypothetical protein